MGDQELNLNFNKITLFKDLEDGSELKIDPTVLKTDYQDRLLEWVESLREGFRNEGVDYALINMAEPMDQLINRFLWHRKKLI